MDVIEQVDVVAERLQNAIVAEADSLLTDWEQVDWTPANAANFFEFGECDYECDHPHSHFENLRAEVFSTLASLEEDGDDRDLRDEALQHLTETLTPLFAAAAAHVEALRGDIFRLAGPKCPHDEKYAIEHGSAKFSCFAMHHEFWSRGGETTCAQVLGTYGECSRGRSEYIHSKCGAHKPWPEGEAWLRSNGR